MKPKAQWKTEYERKLRAMDNVDLIDEAFENHACDQSDWGNGDTQYRNRAAKDEMHRRLHKAGFLRLGETIS